MTMADEDPGGVHGFLRSRDADALARAERRLRELTEEERAGGR